MNPFAIDIGNRFFSNLFHLLSNFLYVITVGNQELSFMVLYDLLYSVVHIVNIAEKLLMRLLDDLFSSFFYLRVLILNFAFGGRGRRLGHIRI
jgi:hypothetical protein